MTQLHASMAGATSNAIPVDGGFLLPVDTSITWANHFAARGWNSPQDQINAGYSMFMQPAVWSGWYEETFDAGHRIGEAVITIAPNIAALAGADVRVDFDVQTAQSEAGPWETVTDSKLQNFRLLKVRCNIVAPTDDRLTVLSDVQVSITERASTDASRTSAAQRRAYASDKPSATRSASTAARVQSAASTIKTVRAASAARSMRVYQ